MYHKRHKPFQKLFSIALIVQIADVSCTKPRGVSPDMASLFDSSRDFMCFDESFAIPFDRVNDDYCDCNDGSDEPGTSACPNGSFYCANKGFRSKRLLSSRINDGVCDCCDGSDEWAKFTTCQNQCQAFLEAEKLAHEEFAKVTIEGLKAKNDLVEKAFELRSEVYYKIDDRKVERDQAFEHREKLREMKELAEIPEFKILEEIRTEKKALEEIAFFENEKKAEEKSLKIFDKLDYDQNGVLTKEDVAREIRFDQNNDGVVSDDEVVLYMGRRDSIPRGAFFKEGWPLISHLFQPDANPPTTDYEDYDYDDDEEEDSKDSQHSPSLRSDEIDQIDVESLDDDSKKIIEAANEARKAFDAADKEYLGIVEEIEEMENELKFDCGEDHQFLPLVKECFELTVGDYIYKHCLMDYCSQTSSIEGSEVRLGNWEKWSGPESERHSQMTYSNGERCWNGPSRSVKVNLVCGTENTLKSVSEPSKCEYLFVFETPAICHEVEPVEPLHEEL